MANIKLDFSKMKHVRSDEHSTTLRHPEGHEIKLAHKALSPENQQQLLSLAKLPIQDATPSQQKQLQPKMADGGIVDWYEDQARKGNLGTAPQMEYGGDQALTPAVSPNNGVDVRTPEQKAAALRYEQTGELPEVPIKSGNAAPAPAASPTPAMAEGGDVKDFVTPPKEKKQETTVLDYTKMKQDRIKPGAGTLNYKELNEQYAKKNSIRKADGGEVAGHPGAACPMCGGGMAHYDEGGDVAQQVVPNYQDPMAATQEAPKAELPTEIKRTREIYNDIVAPASNPAVRGKFGTPYDPGQFGPNGEEPANFDPKNWQQAQQQETQEKETNAANIAAEQQKAIMLNQARVQAGLAPIPIPNVPDGQQVPGSPEAPQAGQTPDQAPQISNQDQFGQGMQNTQDMMTSGYNKAMTGIQQAAQAQGQLGQEQAKLLQTGTDARTQALAQYQQDFKTLNDERQNFIKDVQAGYVDPNKYWTGDANGDGSHSKIAAGVGMILGGFNPSNKPNAAIDFLKYQMDKNIEAQSKNLDAKQNLLLANTRQFGNIRDGLEMTRIMQGDMMQMQLQQAASKAATPMAKAAALQAAGQLQMEFAPRFQQFAMQRAMMNLAQNGADPASMDHMLGYMRVVNPEMAKEVESRYVPGVGISPNQPVPQNVREQIIAKQNLHNLATDLLQYSSTHTNLVRGTPEYNTGALKAFNLKQVYREAQLGGILRQGEMPLLDSILSANPAGALKAMSSIPKLKSMIELNNDSLNTLKRGYGLPETKIQQPPVIRKTADGKSAMFDPETKRFLGYQK
jgi:hypothetical protein